MGFGACSYQVTEVPRQQLATGERKSIATDRVVLVPGPASEVFWVGEIYRLFTAENRTFAGIAAELHRDGERRPPVVILRIDFGAVGQKELRNLLTPLQQRVANVNHEDFFV
jgi:hypothetical protein